MSIEPFFMVGGVEPLTPEAVAVVCDGDLRHEVRADVLLVRIRDAAGY